MNNILDKVNSHFISILHGNTFPLSWGEELIHQIQSNTDNIKAAVELDCISQFSISTTSLAIPLALCYQCHLLPIDPVICLANGLVICQDCTDNNCLSASRFTLLVPLVQWYYENITVHCKICDTNCKLGSSLQGLAQHLLNECQLKCFNYQCHQSLNLTQLATHIQNCSKLEILCPFAAYLTDHNQPDIPFRCNARLARNEMAAHIKQMGCDKMLAVLQYAVEQKQSAQARPRQADNKEQYIRRNHRKQTLSSNTPEIEQQELNPAGPPPSLVDNAVTAANSMEAKFVDMLHYGQYSIRILSRHQKIYARWVDVTAPLMKAPEHTRALKAYVDKNSAQRFGVSTDARANKVGWNVTAEGIVQWMNSWGEKNWAKQDPYRLWLEATLLPFMKQHEGNKPQQTKNDTTNVESGILVQRVKAYNEDMENKEEQHSHVNSAQALTELSNIADRINASNISFVASAATRVAPKRKRARSTSAGDNNNSKSKPIKRICTIVRRVLDRTYQNPPTRHEPIGKTREQLVEYVKNLLTQDELRTWQTFEKRDAKECNKDFSRAVTDSPYKTFGDSSKGCGFRPNFGK
jgi:hypothetical protein